MKKKLVLASESPFRKALMHQIGLSFTTAKPTVDEEDVKSRLDVDPKDLAQHLARAKAESLVTNFPESIIIGSDQVLLLSGEVLNKPQSKGEVIARLQQLQGKTHQLHTAISIFFDGHWKEETVIAELKMKPLNADQINKYYQLDQATDCAGGYKIECHGPLLFDSIQTSDYFSIIGLPLLSLVRILDDLGNSPL